MVGQNYFIAVAGRVLCKPKTKYFIGYFIDKGTEKERFDMVISEKNELLDKANLSESTINKYQIFSLALKSHIKDFQQQAVDAFNKQESKYGNEYFSFKRMMLGLFLARLEEKGYNIHEVDLKNINHIIGEVKQ